MRLRYVPNGREICESHPEIVIEDPESHKGNWRQFFNKDESASLSLEIGCGKGQFLTESAKLHEENCYIGLEMMTSVICRAVQRVAESKVSNLYLVNRDGSNILDYFNEGEVDRLYLNFPDPWPKKRHEKRRLTAPSFLEKYKIILKEDGVFRLRTDNYPLYEFSLENLSKVLEDGFKFGEVPLIEGDIMTEFETKFRNAGNPIYFIEGKFKR